jgi:asparagine synthase (glutamine-hydrolysing)
MANSLEVRSPFLDYRVVEFGLSLPARYKINKGENKHILREIARSLVPPKLIDRPKMGFGIPRARWLREEFRELTRDLLLDQRSRSRGWYRFDQVEKTLRIHDLGQDVDSLIWPMLMLELWARNWID